MPSISVIYVVINVKVHVRVCVWERERERLYAHVCMCVCVPVCFCLCVLVCMCVSECIRMCLSGWLLFISFIFIFAYLLLLCITFFKGCKRNFHLWTIKNWIELNWIYIANTVRKKATHHSVFTHFRPDWPSSAYI